MRVIESGLASTGDDFIAADLITSASIYWVDSVHGNDSNAGSKELPLATLAAAVALATTHGDIIIIKAGHSETISSPITIDTDGVMVFGLGTGSSAPNFTGAANQNILILSAIGIQLHNLYFPASTTINNTNGRISCGDNCLIKNCTFICGQYDLRTIATGASLYPTIEDCNFSVSADGPDEAIFNSSASLEGLKVKGCTFDGGTYNWDNAAIYSTAAHTCFIYDSNTLTNNAKIRHTSSTAKGTCSGMIVDEGSEVSFA